MQEVPAPYRIRDWFSFQSLIDAEQWLYATRRLNREFSDAVRNGQRFWDCDWKVRNEELLPLKKFAETNGVARSDSFRLTPQSTPGIDAELKIGKVVSSVQITVAFETWDTSPKAKSGYNAHLLRRATRQDGFASCTGVFKKEAGRVIQTNESRAVTAQDIVQAMCRGMVTAVKNKSEKKQGADILLVYLNGSAGWPELDDLFRKAVAYAQIPRPAHYGRLVFACGSSDVLIEAD